MLIVLLSDEITHIFCVGFHAHIVTLIVGLLTNRADAVPFLDKTLQTKLGMENLDVEEVNLL